MTPEVESPPELLGGSPVPLESVLFTDELNRRPSRAPDYETENRALIAMAEALTESPDTILQKMAEVMLETFRAGSSGISLLTKDDGGKNFYWPAIAGAWKSHIGGGTPRDFGPCGDVLDHDCPLLFKRPERRYTYLQTEIPIEEALLVPFYIKGRAVGAIWLIAHDDRRKFDAEDLRQLVSLGRFASSAFQTLAFRETTVAMNEALLIGSVRQHELAEAAEKLNAQLQVEVLAREKTARELSDKARELAEKARLIDLSNDAIIVRDLDDKIRLWNKGAEKLFGWTFEEVRGKDLHALLHTEFPKPKEEIMAQLQREGRFNGEVVQIARDGRRVRSLCGWVLDRDTESIFTSYTDITQRKKAEDELHQAHVLLADRAVQLEALVTERTTALRETVGELEAFSYSIAHDMRAPLRAMSSFARILQTEHQEQLDEDGKGYLERIVSAAQRQDRLITDILNYSTATRQKLDMHTVDLEKLLEEAIYNHPEFELPRAEIKIQVPLLKVIAHEPSVMQCITNFLANAVKFVAPGVVPKVTVRSELIGPDVRLWFEDNGIGISPSGQERIFALFGRLNPDAAFEGTGIGLAIVRKATERMGGKFGVESEPGKGSRFWIQLKKA